MAIQAPTWTFYVFSEICICIYWNEWIPQIRISSTKRAHGTNLIVSDSIISDSAYFRKLQDKKVYESTTNSVWKIVVMLICWIYHFLLSSHLYLQIQISMVSLDSYWRVLCCVHGIFILWMNIYSFKADFNAKKGMKIHANTLCTSLPYFCYLT